MTGENLQPPEDVEAFEHEGFRCTIRRNPEIGILLGYVDLPPGHPWYGRTIRDLDGLDVHGGITYAEAEGDAWRIGFDCGHFGDGMPALFRNAPPGVDPFPPRSVEYVRDECRKLAGYAAGEATIAAFADVHPGAKRDDEAPAILLAPFERYNSDDRLEDLFVNDGPHSVECAQPRSPEVQAQRRIGYEIGFRRGRAAERADVLAFISAYREHVDKLRDEWAVVVENLIEGGAHVGAAKGGDR